MSFSSLPTRTNGTRILNTWFDAIRTAGIAAEASISAGPIWLKYTVTHVDLQVAALTNDISFLTLPVKGILEGLIIKHSTAFSGGAISSYKIDLGIGGELDRYLAQFDVFSAVSGSNFNIAALSEIPSFTATTSIRIKATSIGANLNASTAGSLDIWAKYATLT